MNPADWAIRIEFQSNETDYGPWQIWDKAYFALQSAKPILEALLACCSAHPRHIIRINAEKYHPQTRLFFTAYNPQYLPPESGIKTQTYSDRTSRQHKQAPGQLRLIDR